MDKIARVDKPVFAHLDDIQNYLFEKHLTVEELVQHFPMARTTMRSKLSVLKKKKVVTTSLKEDSIGNALIYTATIRVVAPPNSRIVRLSERPPLNIGSYQDTRRISYGAGSGKL